jgi:beta-glucanase (GH16 family)
VTALRRPVFFLATALLVVAIAVGLTIATRSSADEADNGIPPSLAGRFRHEQPIALGSVEKGLPAFWQVDHIGGNDELQRYRPENVTSSAGLVELVATAESGGIRSGAVNIGFEAEGLVRPGDYVQARLRFPSGAGLWGALWLMPLGHDSRQDASTPEVDVVETIGGERGTTQHFVHYDGVDEGFTRLIDFTQWHTYGVWLADDGVHYFVDGIEIGSNPPAPTPESGAWGIIVNLAVGGLAGDPSPSSLPGSVQISAITRWS